MGRKTLDPEILKQNQREARDRWRRNNREKDLQTSLAYMRKRYHNDEEYRLNRLQKARARYLYNKEASLLRNIVCS